jgi:hypothetical protein
LEFCVSFGFGREGEAENEEPLLILNGSTSSSWETGFCFACGNAEAQVADKIKSNEKTLLIVSKRPQKAFKQVHPKKLTVSANVTKINAPNASRYRLSAAEN